MRFHPILIAPSLLLSLAPTPRLLGQLSVPSQLSLPLPTQPLPTQPLPTQPLPTQPLRWTRVKMELPPSIQVCVANGNPAGGQAASPRAWSVDIDYNDQSLRAQPWLSKSATGRETGSAMAKQLGALVAINGGYFDMMRQPARTFSLVMRNGKVEVPNISVVKRPNPSRAYAVTRSAFGIRANRTFDVAWVAQQGDVVWAYPKPVAHTATTVAASPAGDLTSGGKVWDVVDALGAGPTLISDGVIQDSYENEVFFDSGFPNNEPYSRSAIGYTKNNHLILFTTDSRSRGQGLTLLQTAREMQRLGCVEAMNLDGGGSETLVVKGQTLNQAAGQDRAITSILAIVPNTSTIGKTKAASTTR